MQLEGVAAAKEQPLDELLPGATAPLLREPSRPLGFFVGRLEMWRAASTAGCK